MHYFSFNGGFSDWSAFDIPIVSWIVAAVVAAIVTVVLNLVKHFGATRLSHHAARTKKDWHNLLTALAKQTNFFVLLAFGVFIGSLTLRLSAASASIIQKIVIIVLLVQVALWTNSIITFFIRRVVTGKMAKDPGAAMTVSALGFVIKIAFYSLIILIAFENLGINVTALVAGLGIGGVAVALAAQNMLGDLFSSLSIVVDKPFVIGDYIVVDDFMGTVEHIGLKTTRIRSLSGEQIVFGNTDLLKSRIRNYKRMFERRVVFTVGVTYDTPHEKLLRIPKIIREGIEGRDGVRFDRSHFSAFGDSSLNFESVYFVTSPDYTVYMDIHQAINLHIHKRFVDEKIEFAFPTRTLYVKQDQPGEPAP